MIWAGDRKIKKGFAWGYWPGFILGIIDGKVLMGSRLAYGSSDEATYELAPWARPSKAYLLQVGSQTFFTGRLRELLEEK